MLGSIQSLRLQLEIRRLRQHVRQLTEVARWGSYNHDIVPLPQPQNQKTTYGFVLNTAIRYYAGGPFLLKYDEIWVI